MEAVKKITDVTALYSVMREMPQAELDTVNYFAHGLYARVLPRPAGTVIVGKVHKQEHFYIVAKGSVRVACDGEMRDYHAGELIVSKPGTRRAVFALEDSICMTVHHTFEKDLDKIEKELIEPDGLALFNSDNKLKSLT